MAYPKQPREKKQCLNCGKDFEVITPSTRKKKFCNCDCMRNYQKGENNPNYGNHPIPWNKGLNGVNGNCGAPKGTTPHNKGKSSSLKTRIKQSLSRTGEKIFTGFKSDINKLIRGSTEYKKWVLMVFGRDTFTCQDCKVRGVYLEAHHIKSFSTIIKEYDIKTLSEAKDCKELWDLNNGITYCIKCHMKHDIQRAKFNKEIL